jgi:NADH-quinone oxidoreductase subunit M
MLALILIAFPLLSGILLFGMDKGTGKTVRGLALTLALAEFILSLVAYFIFRKDPFSENLRFDIAWVESLNIHFDVSINALSLLMILLTTFLVPVIILSSFRKNEQLSRNFYALIFIMQMALIGVFTANDGFLFYVFWELALIPIYFICLLWGAENRAKITLRFFIYTLFGSLFMLVGLIYLYQHTGVTGEKSWNVYALYEAGRSLPMTQQGGVFWLIFIAFAIKMPIVPFHSWQPDTYVNAPTQGSMLLSGIMLKMGTFGMIKWLIPVVPLGIQQWGSLALSLSVLGIVYASLVALAQKDFKRLIAYSSIAHVGLISAGIIAANQQGLQGAIMQMMAHGVNVVGLFFIAELLIRKTGTRRMDMLGGLRGSSEALARLFLIILLGSVALPLTNGFIGEFLLLNGIYQYNAIMAAVSGATVVLGAAYMLRSYQKIMLGEPSHPEITFIALERTEKVVLIIICVVVVGMGVYPKPLNEIAELAAHEIMLIMP